MAIFTAHETLLDPIALEVLAKLDPGVGKGGEHVQQHLLLLSGGARRRCAGWVAARRSPSANENRGWVDNRSTPGASGREERTPVTKAEGSVGDDDGPQVAVYVNVTYVDVYVTKPTHDQGLKRGSRTYIL